MKLTDTTDRPRGKPEADEKPELLAGGLIALVAAGLACVVVGAMLGLAGAVAYWTFRWLTGVA